MGEGTGAGGAAGTGSTTELFTHEPDALLITHAPELPVMRSSSESAAQVIASLAEALVRYSSPPIAAVMTAYVPASDRTRRAKYRPDGERRAEATSVSAVPVGDAEELGLPSVVVGPRGVDVPALAVGEGVDVVVEAEDCGNERAPIVGAEQVSPVVDVVLSLYATKPVEYEPPWRDRISASAVFAVMSAVSRLVRAIPTVTGCPAVVGVVVTVVV